MNGPLDLFSYLRDTRYITRHTGSKILPFPDAPRSYHEALAHANFAALHPHYAQWHTITNVTCSLIIVGMIYYAVITCLRAFTKSSSQVTEGNNAPPCDDRARLKSLGRAAMQGTVLVFSVSYILWYSGFLPSSSTLYPEPVRLSYCYGPQNGQTEVCHISVSNQSDRARILSLNAGQEKTVKAILSGAKGFSVVTPPKDQGNADTTVDILSGKERMRLPAALIYKWRSDRYV